MWPIVLVPLNLPQKVRTSPGSLMLAGIIPGREEPKTTNPYLQVLVDDLLDLNGTTIYDAFRKESFELKVDIMLHQLDYPGQNKVFNCQGAGAYCGCCYCCVRGEYSKCLKKMVYLGHRMYLPSSDTLHNDKHFPHAKDPAKPPMLKDMAFIDAANEEYDSAPASRRKEIARRSGCKGTYALRQLPAHDRIQNTPTDPMHLIKNVAEHVVRLISGAEDSFKVRMEEKCRKRFRRAWVKPGSTTLPTAPFRLSTEDKAIANKRAQKINVPIGFDWKPRKLFQKKAVGMKSHEWKQIVSSGILKFCIRGLLGASQRATIFELCDVLAHVCAEELCMAEMDSLEHRIHRVLALLERDFPVSLHVISFHLLHHLPLFLKRFGPVYGYWMYPLERFNSWISKRVMSRRFPEATVVETYRLYEFAHFLQVSGQLPLRALTVPTDSVIDETDVCSTGRSHSAALTTTELEQLDQHYLQTVSQYKALRDKYEEAKRIARLQRRLRGFPRLKDWRPDGGALSPEEVQMCVGPVNEITKYDSISRESDHGRIVTFTAEETDRVYSTTCSSYVSAQRPGIPVAFGRIQFLFSHSFNGSTSALACVQWFDSYTKDQQSGLIFVSVETCSKTCDITPVSALSRPLVTATEDNKLWILNYCN